MRSIWPSVAAAVLCGLLLWCSTVRAEDGGRDRGAERGPAPAKGSPAEPAATAPAKPVEEAQPPLYYLKDKKGELQPVPNFTLEDFEELYKLKHQLVQGDQRPRYSLQQISATGAVTAAGYAELVFQVHVLVREDQWTRVPLRLDQAVLREPVQYQGPGEQIVHFEGEGEGYVAWIRGPAGKQHQLTLKVFVPLTTVGEETRLRLLVPRATTSELKLKVPIAGAAAKVSEGATLRTPTSGKTDTDFTVLGLGGDFEMSWYRAGARIAEVPTVLEASGTISARIETRTIDAEATLSVRSYGAAFDRFRVRLPQDSDLVPGTAPGYTIVPVKEDQPPGSRQGLVEVRLAKRTTGPVEVRLAVTRAHDATKPGPWLELAGFEVEGAVRQWGTIAVSAAGDWQVLWGPSRGVRQIDQLPEALRRKDIVAGFDYSTQPCSLTARLVPKRTRINVEPEYVLLVDSDQVRLEAKLKYTVRGTKISALDLTMPDWQIDEVGPENVVAADAVPSPSAGSAVSIPLMQPSIGQFEVRLRAHRPIAADAKSLSVTLPQPQANAPAAAVVVVLPADNIELIPNSKLTKGLLRQQTAVPMELPARQQEPLFYRSDAAKAVFAADLRRHAQRISVDVVSQVNLDGQGGRVEQKLAYRISYEPTDFFILDVPRTLAESGRMEIKHDDQAVLPILLADASDDPSKPVRMRVGLPKACIGLCELSVRYPLPTQKAGAPPASVTVPLVMPAEGELASNRLYITAAPGLRVEARPGPWTALESGFPRLGQPRGLQLSTKGPAGVVELWVQGESGGETPLVVERAWIQTWLTSAAVGGREDRAVYLFTSPRREVEISLPAGAARDAAVLLLDGKRATARTTPDGNLALSLVADGGASRHLLDVRYHFPDLRPPQGRMSIDLPRLGGETWTRRMYWQLIVPREEHVIIPPAGFTPECTWCWRGYFWGRQSLMDQSQLEAWVGLTHTSAAAASAPRCPPGVNCYLYSSLGNVNHCELRTVGRSTLVLAASGLALLVGLLLIYLPALRHPAGLLAAAVLLAALGILYPEIAILGGQAAGVGLVLALSAAMLSRSFRRPHDVVLFSDHLSEITALAAVAAPSEHPISGVGGPISSHSAKVVATASPTEVKP